MLRVMDAETLAGRLTAAGVDDVRTDGTTRAMYSSDASLYRVPPAAWSRPRATPTRSRPPGGVPRGGRAAHRPRRGHVDRRQRRRTGVVLDFSRHLNRVLDGGPRRARRRSSSRRGAGGAAAAAAPHGLRFGPDPSTHTRCTIGGMIGNNACGSRALGYGRTVGQRGRAASVLTGTGERSAGRTGTIRRRVSTTCARWSAGRAWRPSAPSSAGSAGRSPATRWSTCCPSAASTSPGCWSAARARSRSSPRRPCGWSPSPAPGPGGARLSRHRRRPATPTPRLLAAPPDRLRGHRLAASSTWCADAAGRSAVPPLPRGAAWLFVEIDRRRPPPRSRRPGRALGRRPARWTSAGRHRPGRGGRAVADPRGRRRAGRPQPRRAPGARRLGGRRRPAGSGSATTCATSTRCCAEHGLTGVPYGHFGDGCVHVRIDFPLGQAAAAPQVFRAFLEDAAAWSPATAARCPASTATAGPAASCCRRCTPPTRSACSRAVKDAVRPRQPAQPRRARRPATRSTPTSRVGRRPGRRASLALAYPHDGGDFAAGRAPLHRGRQVPGRHRRDRRRDVPVLPGHPRGEGLHPRPRPGAAGDGRRRAGRRWLAIPGGARRARPVPVLQGLRVATARPASTWRPTRPRCCTRPTGAGCGPASHYTLGRLPRWARAGRPRCRALANAADAACRGCGRLAKWPAGVDQRRAFRRSPARPSGQWFEPARPAPRRRAGRCCSWTRSPTTSPPRSADAAVRVLEAAGYAPQVPGRAACCGLTWITTGQLDAARRILRPHRRDAGAAALDAGVPIVGLEPSCTAVLRCDAAELLDTDDARAVAARRPCTLAELLDATPRLDAAVLAGVEVVAQPHCHHHAVLGWDGRRRAARAGRRRRSPGSAAAAGWPATSASRRGHYEVSVAVAEQQLLPAVRRRRTAPSCWPTGSPAAPSSTDLAGRRGQHLAAAAGRQSVISAR